jgi:hypothetical protein
MRELPQEGDVERLRGGGGDRKAVVDEEPSVDREELRLNEEVDDGARAV